MTAPVLHRIFEEGLAAAIPDGGLSISTWAESYRYVERSARPGRWSNEVVPFLTEIMDCVTEPDVREVVFLKSSQVGGSELAVNIIGYFIHIDPTYILYIAEQEDKAKAWTQESFDTTVVNTEVLRNLVSEDPSSNNQRIKRFPGGQLTIAWASSPAQLSSRPARIVIFDERDAFIPTNEGDAVKLAQARTKTFSGQEKVISISTPRDAVTSTMEPAYLAGDQREYHVPCPHCHEFQVLKWANVKWDDDPGEAYMVCEVHGCVIEHDHKPDMLAAGRWFAKEPFRGIASFKINELYSPFTTWGMMASDFLEAKKKASTLKVFVNTRLGETWKDEERIEYADLQLSREQYEAPVPAGVLLLTAGVDVQGDRLECEIVGWGRDDESWSIDYRVIEGDPALPEVWDDLTDHLTQVWEGETRTFRISAACIDSGGHHTKQVYRFCHANKGRKWIAVKGSSTPTAPLIGKPSLVGKNPKVRLYTIGTNAAKDEIFSFLRVSEPGSPGFCHFPDDDRYDDRYLKQLCSEKKVPRFRGGREIWQYEKVSAGARNEALDLRVYATAARAILNPNYEAIARRRLNHDPVVTEQRPARSEFDEEISDHRPEPPPAEPKPKAVKGKRIKTRNPFAGNKW